VLLAVADTGVGMDEAMRAHLFEPFYTTKGPGKGTGLGLATVYAVVQQAGGAVEFISQPGQGTRVLVYLPRATEAGPAGETGPNQPVALGGAETVLLVEDEPQVRKLIREVLRGRGYTVLEAGDGVEALRVAAGHAGPIHLLVTDVVMPRLSGRALAEHLMALRPALKVLYLSGHTDDAVTAHGVREGVSFLQKPFTPDALAGRVREVLAER
jgi:CheY-like chemotaxis protein